MTKVKKVFLIRINAAAAGWVHANKPHYEIHRESLRHRGNFLKKVTIFYSSLYSLILYTIIRPYVSVLSGKRNFRLFVSKGTARLKVWTEFISSGKKVLIVSCLVASALLFFCRQILFAANPPWNWISNFCNAMVLANWSMIHWGVPYILIHIIFVNPPCLLLLNNNIPDPNSNRYRHNHRKDIVSQTTWRHDLERSKPLFHNV